MWADLGGIQPSLSTLVDDLALKLGLRGEDVESETTGGRVNTIL